MYTVRRMFPIGFAYALILQLLSCQGPTPSRSPSDSSLTNDVFARSPDPNLSLIGSEWAGWLWLREFDSHVSQASIRMRLTGGDSIHTKTGTVHLSKPEQHGQSHLFATIKSITVKDTAFLIDCIIDRSVYREGIESTEQPVANGARIEILGDLVFKPEYNALVIIGAVHISTTPLYSTPWNGPIPFVMMGQMEEVRGPVISE